MEGLSELMAGTLQYAFSANFGVCNSFRTELKALELELELAARMEAKKLMIQVDNQAAVAALRSSDDVGGDGVHIIINC